MSIDIEKIFFKLGVQRLTRNWNERSIRVDDIRISRRKNPKTNRIVIFSKVNQESAKIFRRVDSLPSIDLAWNLFICGIPGKISLYPDQHRVCAFFLRLFNAASFSIISSPLIFVEFSYVQFYSLKKGSSKINNRLLDHERPSGASKENKTRSIFHEWYQTWIILRYCIVLSLICLIREIKSTPALT